MRKSCSLKLCFLASFKHNLSNENICFRLNKSCHLIENCTSFMKQLCLKLLTGIKSLQFAKKAHFSNILVSELSLNENNLITLEITRSKDHSWDSKCCDLQLKHNKKLFQLASMP